MTTLSVNVNKLATLRNARGKNNPDVLSWALEIVTYGAHGITVHPRPDERHIRYRDVYALAEHLTVELNIEGYPDERFLTLVEAIQPAQCTLVPDPPHVLTSQAGWDVVSHQAMLKEIVTRLQDQGIRTSLFIDPETLSKEALIAIQHIKPVRVELYTEAYAVAYDTPQCQAVLLRYQTAAAHLQTSGIAINAGHDLDLNNLPLLIQTIPQIKEVSIGHALICDALRFGMQETIQRYLDGLKGR